MIARLSLIVLFLFALPLGANRPMWWILLALAILVLFIFQVFENMRRGIPSTARRVLPFAMIFLTVLAWGLFQSLVPVPYDLAHPVWSFVPTATPFISADPIAGLHHILRLSSYAMVFWIALCHSANADQAEASLKWIAIFISVLSGYGIVAVVSGTNPLLLDLASSSVSASFVNRNNFATYAVIGLLANLSVYSKLSADVSSEKSKQLRDFLEAFFREHWVYAAGFLVCLAAILLSQSRAGLAAAGLGLAVFVLTGRQRGGARRTIAGIFILALLIFAGLALSSGVLERLLADTSEEARFLIYPLVVDGITDRPLLGHGLGAFQDAFRPYLIQELSRSEIDLAHSSYLENVFELGLPAAFLFYGVLLAIALAVLRGALVRRRNRHIPRFAIAVIAAGAFHAFFDFSLQIPAIAALFAFVLGLGWAQAFRRRKKPDEFRQKQAHL